MVPTESEWRVEVQPNRSLSRAGIVGLLIAYLSVSLIIGVGFAWIGAWLVLPFFGLELAVVAAVLAWVWRHRADREWVRTAGDRLEVAGIRGARRWRREYPRYWARTLLERDRGGWYGSRLKIGAHGDWVEIAGELNEERRQAVWRRLHSLLRSGAQSGREERPPTEQDAVRPRRRGRLYKNN